MIFDAQTDKYVRWDAMEVFQNLMEKPMKMVDADKIVKNKPEPKQKVHQLHTTHEKMRVAS